MVGQLLTEEELILRNTVREFAEKEIAPRAAHYDETSEFPWDNIYGLGELGLFGLGIAEEYGGSGGTTRCHSRDPRAPQRSPSSTASRSRGR